MLLTRSLRAVCSVSSLSRFYRPPLTFTMSTSATPAKAKASYSGSISTKEGFAIPPAKQSPLHLLTLSTPNGQKVQIGLEELKEVYGDSIEWTWEYVNIMENIQKEHWFLQVCPNGRIPVLIDNAHTNATTKKPFPVFESAAILLYLAKVYDKDDVFGFKDDFERNECLQWMFFAHGGVGPMQGQLNHFNVYAPEKIPYAIKRYRDETRRLFGVIEGRLAGTLGAAEGEGERDWLVGEGKGKFSWADMNVMPWINIHTHSGIPQDEFESDFPHTQKWIERITSRPGAKRGLEGYGKPE